MPDNPIDEPDQDTDDDEGEEGSQVDGIEPPTEVELPKPPAYADKEFVEKMFGKLLLEMQDLKAQIVTLQMKQDETFVERFFRKVSEKYG